jgi:holo-[acyl-carrier protein] synthase
LILGFGTDICPVFRWEHLYARFGKRIVIKIFNKDDALYLLSGNSKRLPERLAGRWAILEAFGKATKFGMNNWSWKQLRFLNGQLWVEDELAVMLTKMGANNIHASVSHDAGIAFAVVILETTNISR